MPSVSVTETMPSLTNRYIDNGRLKLLEALGSGAYGKVYRALDTASPRNKHAYYAVKCLHKPKPGTRQEEFQRREVALHKLVCDHPNIVTIHKVLSDDHYVFVVLDLCTGGDLFTAITESRVFADDDDLLKQSFVELLDAVHYCHENGVFHRDIKPENVLCSPDGSNLLLADFGLSTRRHVSKDFGCGSSYYMSPECIGKEVHLDMYSTRHSDVWSLGIILVNMATGRNPWRYATTKDECFSAFLHDHDFLRQVLPISEGLNSIVKHVFVLNPLHRITIPELRTAILKLDTFFMSQHDLSYAPECVRDAAKSYGMRVPPSQPCLPPPPKVIAEAVVVDSDFSNSSGDSGVSESAELVVFPLPPEEVHLTVDQPLSVSVVIQNLHGLGIDGTFGTPHSSGSGPESAGPITPATYAVDPDIEVPDLPEGENLGEPMVASVVQPAKPSTTTIAPLAAVTQEPSNHKHVFKPSHFFLRAVQRLKGISSASRI